MIPKDFEGFFMEIYAEEYFGRDYDTPDAF